VFLRVRGRDLAADLLERLDDPNRAVAMADVVGGRQAHGPRPENRDVANVVGLSHDDEW
jgi:hypothetical protein